MTTSLEHYVRDDSIFQQEAVPESDFMQPSSIATQPASNWPNQQNTNPILPGLTAPVQPCADQIGLSGISQPASNAYPQRVTPPNNTTSSDTPWVPIGLATLLVGTPLGFLTYKHFKSKKDKTNDTTKASSASGLSTKSSPSMPSPNPSQPPTPSKSPGSTSSPGEPKPINNPQLPATTNPSSSTTKEATGDNSTINSSLSSKKAFESGTPPSHRNATPAGTSQHSTGTDPDELARRLEYAQYKQRADEILASVKTYSKEEIEALVDLAFPSGASTPLDEYDVNADSRPPNAADSTNVEGDSTSSGTASKDKAPSPSLSSTSEPDSPQNSPAISTPHDERVTSGGITSNATKRWHLSAISPLTDTCEWRHDTQRIAQEYNNKFRAIFENDHKIHDIAIVASCDHARPLKALGASQPPLHQLPVESQTALKTYQQRHPNTQFTVFHLERAHFPML